MATNFAAKRRKRCKRATSLAYLAPLCGNTSLWRSSARFVEREDVPAIRAPARGAQVRGGFGDRVAQVVLEDDDAAGLEQPPLGEFVQERHERGPAGRDPAAAETAGPRRRYRPGGRAWPATSAHRKTSRTSTSARSATRQRSRLRSRYSLCALERSTKTHHAAPRLSASIPTVPTPAKRSSTVAPHHVVAEDVENRLARHLRRGADFFAARAVEPRAARRACDDAHYRSIRFLKYSSVGTSPSRIA